MEEPRIKRNHQCMIRTTLTELAQRLRYHLDMEAHLLTGLSHRNNSMLDMVRQDSLTVINNMARNRMEDNRTEHLVFIRAQPIQN